MAEPQRLYGMKALVTSGAGGIGEAVARTLAKHGAAVIAVDGVNSGVDRLFGAGGAHGIFLSNAGQRRYRDVRASANHLAVSWDLAGSTFGRITLGLDPGTPFV